MIKIEETPKSSTIIKVACPHCNERVRCVGITTYAQISGLTFKCRSCGKYWEVTKDNK